MREPDELDFRLSGYDFVLPEALIAQSPAAERSGSRLMVLRRDREDLEQAMFSDIVRFLPEGCLLVANNSRVVPARLIGQRPSGGKVEFLLLTPLPLLEAQEFEARELDELEGRPADGVAARLEEGKWQRAEAEGLLRPAKKISRGDLLRLASDFALRVLEHGDFGRCRTLVYWRGDLGAVLERRGGLPLPPYIRRGGPGSPDSSGAARNAAPDAARRAAPAAGPWGTDAERYQTVYARPDKAGSVAAPTAGLHFTDDLRREIERSGRQWEEVTLYVGYGTFSPVRSADIREHAMHAEYAELPERTLAAVMRAKAEGRPVIAVGTTSARVLEGVCELRPDLFSGGAGASIRAGAAPFAGPAVPAASAALVEGGGPENQQAGGGAEQTAFAGWLSTFLYPGRPVRVVDGLVTNFHLPQSSLLMLVSALAGRERVLRAYDRAVADDFRFFSYGDAMLIL